MSYFNIYVYKEMSLEQALITKKYTDKMLELLEKTSNSSENQNIQKLEEIQEIHNKLKEFFPELFI
jgi:septum formation inhibitor-activating ATPase MinD